jgi:hypothetical protein
MPSTARAVAVAAAVLLAAALAGCASSSSSGDPPSTVPLTDPAQVTLPIDGPLAQFASDAAKEVASANAIVVRARKHGVTASADPVALGSLHDDYAEISRRFQAICRRAQSQRPDNVGSGVGYAEVNAWRVGLGWCADLTTYYGGVARLLGNAQHGVAPTQAQKDRLAADQAAVTASRKAFRAAYITFAEQTG